MLIEESIPNLTIADFRIMQMAEHDLLEVVEIEETCGLSKWGWESYYSELSRETVMLVAQRNDHSKWDNGKRINGFVAASLFINEMHINNIGVRHSCRRKGVGRALLKAALIKGVSRGAREAFLEVRASNQEAQNLYLRQDFTIVGRRLNYYVEPQEDALIMRAVLSAAL